MLAENNIYLGDCLEFMKEIPDKAIDCVITDPPYGIKRDKGMGGGGNGLIKRCKRTVREYDCSWDNYKPTIEYFNEIIRISKNQIIFGGNYFTELLPQNNHWIVWDKLQTMPSYSDCELIWTSIDKNTVKKYVFNNNGMLSDSKDIRVHPTQKPSELIKKIINDYTQENDLILDPFLGSGTTAIACYDLKRRYIGIEKEPKYYEIAKKRIDDFKMQGRLF